MGFLNPIYLLGLAAAAIPFLIYLWFRRRARIVDFSALTFLLEAHRRSVRRIQLRQLIVLILRALILALIAGAIARPILRGGLPGVDSEAPTACVIILDNSYSMGYEGIKGRWFDVAKRRALEVLDSLKRGDSASLILASDHPDIRFTSFTQNLDEVRVEIQNAKLSYRSTDILRSLEAANELLARARQGSKEIYLITDMRRNGWKGMGRKGINLRGRLFLLPVGEKSPDNIAVTSVKLDRRLLPVNIPVKIEVTVRNHSDAPVSEAVLELSVDGEKKRQMTVSIPQGGEAKREITYIFTTPGYHFGSVRISGDRLVADNERFFSVYVGGGIRALCIGGRGSYLTYALNPSLGLIHEENPTLIPTSLTPERFERGIRDISLESYDLILFGEGLKLGETAAAKVLDYVENGGKLILFLGGEEEVPDLKTLNSILPGVPSQARDENPPLKLGSFDRRHPALEPFDQEMISGPFSPDFFKVYDLSLIGESRRLMSFSDGTPAVVERRVGLGRTILINGSSWNLSWTNLPLKPLFLPLIQQIALYLAKPQQGETETMVGGEARLIVRGARSVKVSLVSGNGFQPISLPVEENDLVRFNLTSRPGIYRIDSLYLSINVSAEESDLTEIKPETISEAFGEELALVDSTSKVNRQIRRMRRGREMWSWLLIMALGLMVVETTLSNMGAGEND